MGLRAISTRSVEVVGNRWNTPRIAPWASVTSAWIGENGIAGLATNAHMESPSLVKDVEVSKTHLGG
jgi:hypothetical protein